MSLVFAHTQTHEHGGQDEWEAARPWPPKDWPPAVPDDRKVTMNTRYDRYGEEIEHEDVLVLTTYRRSRIARTCATCLGEIRPGEQYARHFLPGDGHLTVIEHASAGTCWAVLGQGEP